MIPAEAIKAATQAFIEHGRLIPALEAAAPHMLATAWDDGFEGAQGVYHQTNPYRSAQ